ncbi:MAG: YoaK family protein [Methylocystis sp.]
MNTTPVDPPEERLELVDVALALLSFAAGAMDALAFFSLGEVFPSAMTGNTALLGLAIGQGHLTRASRPFVAFVGFLAGGALASASLETRLRAFAQPQAVWRLLALEACLLAIFALAWALIDRPIADVAVYPLIVAASAAMGIQSVAARLLGRPGITTVVFTSTLTSIVATTTQALLRPPRRLPLAASRQIGMFLIYGLGAGICGLLASQATWTAAMPLSAVLGAAALLWLAAASKPSRAD